jgi:hypothetical protein
MNPDSTSRFAYRFRAECQHDVEQLREILGLRIKKITLIVEPPFPDVDTEIITGLPLEEIRKAMLQIEDSHVMVETVSISEEYTGLRRRAA